MTLGQRACGFLSQCLCLSLEGLGWGRKGSRGGDGMIIRLRCIGGSVGGKLALHSVPRAVIMRSH